VSYSSYVGRLDSEDFFWEDIPDQKYRLGNIPHRLLPDHGADLPFGRGTIEHWSTVIGRDVRQLDWGAWGLALSKRELQTIWEADDKSPSGLRYWQKIADQIDALPDEATYVLVVAENA
jgi:hypothetical protein